MFRAARIFELFVLLAAGSLLAWMLLVPPFIGLADNADFAKVTGRFCLWPAGGPKDNFLYFQPDYAEEASRCWRSEVISSEIGLAAIALAGSKAAGGGSRFDIRWMGALHTALFLLALAVALRATRPWPPRWRIPFALAAIVVFCDVCYSAYFNSFYSDAGAILGFLLAVAAAASMLAGPVWRGNILVFSLGMVLFAGAKAQHALFGPVAVAFVAWQGWKHRISRIAAVISAGLILAVTIASFALTPQWYKGQALFNAVFFRIVKESPYPSTTLSSLLLDSSYLPYAGMHSFMPGSPAQDNDWAARFSSRLGHKGLAEYYFRHPGLALRHLDLALRTEAPVLRPVNLSNFRRVDGHPAGARTSRMSAWSGARSAVLDTAPRVWALFYFAVAMSLAYAGRRLRDRASGRLAALGAVLLAIGAVEFAVAALADACETYRHLLLFHLMTDTALVLGAVVATMEILRRRGDRGHCGIHAAAPN